MALDPRNPIINRGNNFEASVANVWQLVLPVNVFREGVSFQNNSAGDITISKTGLGAAGQGVVVLKANGGYYAESADRDALTGKLIGVHQGAWYVIASAAGPFALEVGES